MDSWKEPESSGGWKIVMSDRPAPSLTVGFVPLPTLCISKQRFCGPKAICDIKIMAVQVQCSLAHHKKLFLHSGEHIFL